LARQGGNTRAYEIPPPRLRGVGEGARPGEKAHVPIVEIRVELWKGLEVEMSENLAEHYTLPTPQQVDDEITEQQSIVLTAHVQSGIS
jgi:hypothetical protein